MPRFVNKATGETVEFTGKSADWAVSSGQYDPEGGLVETSLGGAGVLLPQEAAEFRTGATTGNLGPGEQLAGESAAFGEALFGSAGQEALTGLEGAASGLTLGGSDVLLDLLGAETAERGQVNPNVRIGGQIVGGLAPALVGGLGATPAALAMRAGSGVQGAVGGVAGAAAGAAVEGAIFGAGQGVGNLVIADEPVTASAIVNEVGFNALLGGGLGAALGGGLATVGKAGKAVAGSLKKADEALGGEVAATAKEAQNIVDDLPTGKARTALDLDSDLGQALAAKTAISTRDFSSAADEILATAQHGKAVTLDEFAAVVRQAAEAPEAVRFGDRKSFISNIYERAQGSLPKMSLDDFKANLFEANREGHLVLSRADLVGAMDPKLVAASEMASPDGLARWHFVDRGAVPTATGPSKRIVGMVDNFAEDRAAVTQARDEFRSAWHLGKSDMLTPAALKAFANGTPEQAFKAVAAFDTYAKELNKLARKVPGAADQFTEKLKLNLDELKTITTGALPEAAGASTGTQLLATLALAGGAEQVLPELDGPFDDLLKLFIAYKVAKGALGKKVPRDLGKHPVPSPARPDTKPSGPIKNLAKGKFPEFIHRSARLFGHRQGRTAAGGEGLAGSAGGAMGSVAGSMAMRGLAKVVFGPQRMAGTTGSVLDRLSKLTRIGSGGTQFAGRHGAAAALPVLNSLTFGTDRKGKTLQEAFKYRAEEISTMYTNPTQTLETVHNALEDVRATHLGVGDKLEMWAMSAIEYLYNALPKDPGNMHILGQSTWEPDDLAVSEFASRCFGVDAPVDAMEATMRGAIDPFAVEAVRTVHPELFAEAQRAIMDDLPRLLEESTFDQRIALGQLMGVPTDSSLDPEYVAFIQDVWMQRTAEAEQASTGGAPAPVPMIEPLTHAQQLQV